MSLVVFKSWKGGFICSYECRSHVKLLRGLKCSAAVPCNGCHESTSMQLTPWAFVQPWSCGPPPLDDLRMSIMQLLPFYRRLWDQAR